MDFEPTARKIYSREQAFARAQHYCAYQERSQDEVRNKLYDWGLHKRDVEELISLLVQDNFINEERFALAYAQGKFRIKNWGKARIKQGLKLKKVPDKLIGKALMNIDTDEYYSALLRIITKKAATLAEKNRIKNYYRLTQFAAGKGYESDLIRSALEESGLGKADKK